MGSVEPKVPAITPVLEVPAITPVVIVEPTHGVVAMLGAEEPINGLTPRLLISVEPRGIAPLSVVAGAAGFDSGEAVPADETVPDVGVEHPLEVDADPMPPPSNDEVVPRVADAALPAIPELSAIPELPAIPEEDEATPTQPELLELLDIGLIGVGPKPPGLSSVAPSGIPV